MRANIILTALFAGVALAGPIGKKAIVTDYVTEYVYVYVTAAAAPTVASTKRPAHPHPVKATPTRNVVPATTADEARVPAATGTFEEVVLYHHNIHRANNSADPLTYDNRMAGYAAQVAATCKYGHDLTPGGGGYGQNIAVFGTTANPRAIGASTSIAQAITNMWYNGEVDLFPKEDYGKPTPNMDLFEKWGHYSQIVWQSTTGVGCAAQFCEEGTVFDGMGSWFSVCNYLPAGNVGGAYGDNVKPPLGHPPITV